MSVKQVKFACLHLISVPANMPERDLLAIKKSPCPSCSGVRLPDGRIVPYESVAIYPDGKRRPRG